MQPLNPFDAIAPAFTRTNEILFKPFNWRTSWKLAATSYLGAAAGVFIPYPLLLLLLPVFTPSIGHRASLFLYLAAFFGTLVFMAISYVCVRMELVAFEILVTRAKKVAPLWRACGPRVLPWLGLIIVVGTVCTLLMVPFAVIAFRSLFASIQGVHHLGAPSESTPDLTVLFAFYRAVFGFYAIIAVVFLVPKIVTTFFNDFALPSYLLESASLVRASAQGFRIFTANFGSSLLYFLCKFLLFMAGAIAQNIAVQLLMIPVILLVALGAVLASLVRGTGPAGHLLIAAAAVLCGLLFIAFFLYLVIGFTGYLMTFLNSYTAYYVGSRYPTLGDRLQPPPPPDQAFPPPPPKDRNGPDSPFTSGPLPI